MQFEFHWPFAKLDQVVALSALFYPCWKTVFVLTTLFFFFCSIAGLRGGCRLAQCIFLQLLPFPSLSPLLLYFSIPRISLQLGGCGLMFSVSFHGFNGKILSLSRKNSHDKKGWFLCFSRSPLKINSRHIFNGIQDTVPNGGGQRYWIDALLRHIDL